jgi:hypothetical protein
VNEEALVHWWAVESNKKIVDYLVSITKTLSLCKSVSLLVIKMFSVSQKAGRILSSELAGLQRSHGANCDVLPAATKGSAAQLTLIVT